MFIPCIKILGSDPQGNRLLGKCASFEIIGCYAQTELGHGSDVQNL
jgi:acyl-CoA oxidase